MGKKRGPGRPASADAATPPKLVLLVPVEVRARMQRVRLEQKTHYLDQVLDALEATVDDLADLVAAVEERPQVQGKLFTRNAPAESESVDRRQLTIAGVTPEQLQVIDELAAQFTAGSRSKLCTVALENHLPASEQGAVSGSESPLRAVESR